ncbi:type II toxin-antitoxin system VapC family toxin [Pyrodictium abyssi]|uniref:Type II toxin-antitoxin system VapC family toxin n=1 Tax=Pyrodictium abyssi TaxID=54256 RepID=A0ABN6ZQ99_9CREN|nr:type II toxin-antitoxin system VapC family toxin [Pyrodictium abyssi]
MIVLDTSILVDAVIPFDEHRRSIVRRVLRAVEEAGAVVYEPRLVLVELAGVLARYQPPDKVRSHVERIAEKLVIIDYGVLHDTAYRVALETGCRAADAFFIAAALHTGSLLATNDRIQAANAARMGVEAYYVLQQHQQLIERLRDAKEPLDTMDQ